MSPNSRDLWPGHLPKQLVVAAMLLSLLGFLVSLSLFSLSPLCFTSSEILFTISGDLLHFVRLSFNCTLDLLLCLQLSQMTSGPESLYIGSF